MIFSLLGGLVGRGNEAAYVDDERYTVDLAPCLDGYQSGSAQAGRFVCALRVQSPGL